MEIKDVANFCKYEVYEILDGKASTICLCDDSRVADTICAMYAKHDPKGDAYFYTNVVVPGTFVPGGGWSVCYRRKSNGDLERTELS